MDGGSERLELLREIQETQRQIDEVNGILSEAIVDPTNKKNYVKLYLSLHMSRKNLEQKLREMQQNPGNNVDVKRGREVLSQGPETSDVVSRQNLTLSLESSSRVMYPASPVMSQLYQPTPEPPPPAPPRPKSDLNPNAPEFRPLGSISPLPPAAPSLLTGNFDARLSAPVYDKHQEEYEDYGSSPVARFNQVLNDGVKNAPYPNGKGLIDALREQAVISHVTDTRHRYDKATFIDIARAPDSNYYPKALDPSFFDVTKRRWDVAKWHKAMLAKSSSEIDWKKIDIHPPTAPTQNGSGDHGLFPGSQGLYGSPL